MMNNQLLTRNTKSIQQHIKNVIQFQYKYPLYNLKFKITELNLDNRHSKNNINKSGGDTILYNPIFYSSTTSSKTEVSTSPTTTTTTTPILLSKEQQIEQFFDKVKKKSFIIDNYFNGSSSSFLQKVFKIFNINNKNRNNYINSRMDNSKMKELKILDPFNTLEATNFKSKGMEVFNTVEEDMNRLTDSIISHISDSIGKGQFSDLFSFNSPEKIHPVLSTISNYYFQLKGKRIRPTIVFLLCRALSGEVNSKSRMLSQVVEMIHTASLVHDDVIDDASTRRDQFSINHTYNNKLAVLCGDFLLSKSSLILASIENHEVTKCMSSSICELVEGEFMQARSKGANSFDQYLRKTYLKTGSLITNSCRSAAILADCDREFVDLATDFGKNLGLAFQIIDDLLDYTSSSEIAGKETGVDLKLGLATAPVLFATQEYPELEELITRKFSNKGDVETAIQLVKKSKGIEKTRNLAVEYCNNAIECLLKLPQSASRDSLIILTQTVVTRNK